MDPATSTTVYIGQIEQDALWGMGFVLAGFLAACAQKGQAWLAAKGIQTGNVNWNAILAKGNAYGIMLATDKIKALGWDHVEVHSDIAAAGAQYLIQTEPAALAKAGLGNAASDNQTLVKLQAALIRQLPDAITVAASSPATPPAPPPAPVAVVSASSLEKTA